MKVQFSSFHVNDCRSGKEKKRQSINWTKKKANSGRKTSLNKNIVRALLHPLLSDKSRVKASHLCYFLTWELPAFLSFYNIPNSKSNMRLIYNCTCRKVHILTCISTATPPRCQGLSSFRPLERERDGETKDPGKELEQCLWTSCSLTHLSVRYCHLSTGHKRVVAEVGEWNCWF